MTSHKILFSAASTCIVAALCVVACSGGGTGTQGNTGASIINIVVSPRPAPSSSSSAAASPTPRPSGSVRPTSTPHSSPSPHPSPSPSIQPSLPPSPTPTPVPSGPYHIATAAYDDSRDEGQFASAAQVTQLVSYAQSEGSSKATDDCHSGARPCKAVFYMRPFAIIDTGTSSCVQSPDADVMAAASESWFVHLTGYSDSAHRVWGRDRNGCVMWAMNPNNTAMQTWWLNYLRANADNYDLFFVDISDMDLATATYFHSGGGCTPWPTPCESTQELPNDAAVVAAHVGFVQALNHSNGSPMHFIYQQAFPSLSLADDLSAFASTSRLVAVTCEGCIANQAATVVPSNYKTYLNEMAAINATGAAFYVISDGTAAAGSATQIMQRMVTTGIVWLAYSEGHTIVHPNLERNTSNLAIWPEDLIYPSGPIQTMSSGPADLQVAPGVWRREFTTCYQTGHFFGRCAAVVNSNGSGVTVQSSWLAQTYQHVIALSGGDVLSGGTASVGVAAFTANVTTVPAGGVVLLAR